MRFSRPTSYALHALTYLVKAGQSSPVSTRAISAATGIPSVFLLKALKPCVDREILSSITGPNGGYVLTRPPKAITVLEIIEASEGPLRVTPLDPSPQRNKDLEDRVNKLITQATNDLKERFKSVSLAQLARGR